MTLNHHIENWAEQTPKTIAVQFGREAITFAQLRQRAERAESLLEQELQRAEKLAERLRAMGVDLPE